MDSNQENLIKEVSDLKKALGATKKLLEDSRSDQNSLIQTHSEFKEHQNKMKKDAEEQKVRCYELTETKNVMEAEFEQHMLRIKETFQTKEKELEYIQQKQVPQMDSDVLRLKMLAELEGPHRKELEFCQALNEEHEKTIFDLKRKNQDLYDELENLKKSSERDIRTLRDRSKDETNSLIDEIKKLQDRVEDNKDHEQMRKLKIENENLKIKHSELLNEIEGQSSQINELRTERQQQIWEYNKVIETEREKFRNARNELEGVKLKQSQFEKDRYTLENELVKKRAEIDQLMTQEDNLKNHANKLESECKNLRISENELKTKLQQREEEFQRKITTLELERKRESERLKTDLDSMRDQFDQTSRMNTQQINVYDDQEHFRHEKSKQIEELKIIETKLEVQVRENNRIKRDKSEMEHMYRSMEAEHNKLKEIVQDRENLLDNLTAKLEKQTNSLSMREEENERKQIETVSRLDELEKEKSELNHQLKGKEEEAVNVKKNMKKEIKGLREKVENYKNKVKAANQKLSIIRKNLIGTEVEKIVGSDVTMGLSLDSGRKNKIKDAFRDAGF